ncbi:hypothetical protein BDY21DRAFT_381632 [Lineolata rhizophorae]|uniref:non-specific serine/threonine protein kinase n=1 Tax=Lineolata rhizophorae TaxID=578093 RepID=A0A6A6NQJ9_9PEZI|nr:hypothetical protein BDY21DRAFT_381632 [Lineolata rhizophorae]
MPPKHVYGKRPRAVKSAVFDWSSPDLDKTKVQETQKERARSKTNMGAEMSRIADRLKHLGLEESKNDERDARRVLKKKDANAGKAAAADKDKASGDASKPGQQLSVVVHEVPADAGGEAGDEAATRLSKTKSRARATSAASSTKVRATTDSESTKSAASRPARKLRSRSAVRRGSPQPSDSSAAPPGCPYTAYTKHLLRLGSTRGSRPIPFAEWSDSLTAHFDVIKIAEASYGEVYRLSLNKPDPRFLKADESVIKLIALKPAPVPEPERPLSHKLSAYAKRRLAIKELRISQMSDPSNVVDEVRLLQRLSSIPGFTNFRDATVVQGRPSGAFCKAWKEWNVARPINKKSTFPDPSWKNGYEDDQLWAVVEMQNAGSDLEHVGVQSVWAAWDLFWGVACAVAKAECEAELEHRDLHLGNVCVRNTRDQSDDALSDPEIREVERKRIGFTGLETTIIDYTLSRARMDDGAKGLAFLDMSKDRFFFQGDGSFDYQYNIYRYMHDIHLDGRALSIVEDDDRWERGIRPDWSRYIPLTNVLWLHFVLRTFLITIGAIPQPKDHFIAGSSKPKPNKGNYLLGKLAETENERNALAKAKELDKRLKTLDEALDPKNLMIKDVSENQDGHCAFQSTTELVAWAITEGWLKEKDIVSLGCGN